MPSFGSYLLGAAQIALLALSLGFTAYRLRGRLLPSWKGAPARLVELVAGIALLIWISELLGTFGRSTRGLLSWPVSWLPASSRCCRGVAP